MTTQVVVLSAGRIPDAHSLGAVHGLRNLGCRVTLVCRRVPSPAQVDVFHTVHVLGRGTVTRADVEPAVPNPAETVILGGPPAPGERRGPRPPLPRLVVRKIRDEVRAARRWGRTTRRRARLARSRAGSTVRRSWVASVPRLVRGTAPHSIGPQLRKDPHAAALVGHADLIVALDQGGVRVAWARSRKADVGAVLGLPAALWWVEQHDRRQE